MQYDNLTLEISAKAFTDTSEETMKDVSRTLFRQWGRVSECFARISVLLWIGDGSEILEFSGDMSQEFEWAYWQGIANPLPTPDNPTEQQLKNPNYFPVKYRADAAPRTYAWLKRLIEVIREVGVTETGKPIRIGATFDNGPEFAISRFKYKRHREIAQGHSIYPNSFVTCNAVLHGDTRTYAAFPNGIPEGISLGLFLGRQFRAFSKALGYDYIWLSNGMGFGIETWGLVGTLFDGYRFFPEKIQAATSELKQFWHDFLSADESVVIETRGSNFSAGVEMSTEGAPLQWLYERGVIAPPVNSPSSAIYGNTGNSMSAYMSHIAELPRGHGYSYRYYIHDPWFLNSPWLDRFGREPWDLYPVLSVCRINDRGDAEPPSSVALLTCDDSYGNMPQQVPDEVTPHLLEAFRTQPDGPGPFVWIYPFHEYAELENLEAIFNEDLFIASAIDGGVPLNTVMSTRVFRILAESKKDYFRQTMPIIPAYALKDAKTFRAVAGILDGGMDVIVYGSLAKTSVDICELLGLAAADGLCGEAVMRTPYSFDSCEAGDFSRKVFIVPNYEGGPLVECAAGAREILTVEQQGQQRVLVSYHTPSKGSVVFVRSLLPLSCLDPAGRNPRLNPGRGLFGPNDPVAPSDRLLRVALAQFGWTFRTRAYEPAQLPPRLSISRNRSAFYFNGYAPDTSVSLEVCTPLGVPIPTGREVRVKRGVGVWPTEKALHRECRAFVRQESDGMVFAKYGFPGRPHVAGRMDVGNVRNAELRVFVPQDAYDVELRQSAGGVTAFYSDAMLPVVWEDTPYGRCVIVRNFTGVVNICWRSSRDGSS